MNYKDALLKDKLVNNKKEKNLTNEYNMWCKAGLNHDEYCKYIDEIRKLSICCICCFGYEISSVIKRKFYYRCGRCSCCIGY